MYATLLALALSVPAVQLGPNGWPIPPRQPAPQCWSDVQCGIGGQCVNGVCQFPGYGQRAPR